MDSGGLISAGMSWLTFSRLHPRHEEDSSTAVSSSSQRRSILYERGYIHVPAYLDVANKSWCRDNNSQRPILQDVESLFSSRIGLGVRVRSEKRCKDHTSQSVPSS